MNENHMNLPNITETQMVKNLGPEEIALLAHDVRSALFGLMGSLDLIEDNKLTPDTLDQVVRARASGSLLRDLVGLVFGDGDVDITTPLSVLTELRLVMDRWQNQANASGVSLNLNAPPSIPDVNIPNRIGFQRVINNIVGNAVKFSCKGAIDLDVKYSETGKLEITISDQGPGFTDTALGILFKFRGRPDDSPEVGSGLGLFISKKLGGEMGGTITAGNRTSGGARITVTLPAVSTQAPVPKNINALPDLSHLNILLAEDNVTNQLVVTQMLKSLGAKYMVASDGVEALELFDRENFDVVLLDIEMPRKSGLEVLREIRERSDAKSGIPLIALTAYVMQEHRERIEAAGADGLIAKPIAGIAPLGNMILQYMHGTMNAADNALLNPEGSKGEVGLVDTATFDVLADTIGAAALAEFLEKVIIDFENISTELINAEIADDDKKIRANSHILISVAGAIGATNLQHCAQDLNAAARVDNKQERQVLNLECIKGISEVVVFLNGRKTP